MPSVKMTNIISDLRAGKPVIVFDSSKRENEADIIYPAEFVTPKSICKLRNDAGGLVCLSIPLEQAQVLNLPYLTDLLASSSSSTLREISCKKTPYGDKPAFSVTVNHKKTFTGITDCDRALTIKSVLTMLKMPAKQMKKYFIHNFYSPGHVSLLLAKPLSERQGHTELSMQLMKVAGLAPAAVLCEMLDGRTGKALKRQDAALYAKKHKLQFVEKKEILMWVKANEN